MPFDEKKLGMPATRADLADLMLTTMSALHQIKWGMDKLNRGEKADDEIKGLQKDYDTLSSKFNEFTGWSSDK